MMHIFSCFFRFLFIFAQSPKLPTGWTGVDVVVRTGCCWWRWRSMKSPKSGPRHQPGQPCALNRMHIFSHFSEFLLIFQHGSILTKKRTLVCVCAKFRKNPTGWVRRERMECGLVRMGPIRLLKIAFDSPARAEYDAHFFIFFAIFIHFCKIQRMPTHTVWSGCQWVGCLEVENEKGTQNWNSTPIGPSLCAESNAHFSTFF